MNVLEVMAGLRQAAAELAEGPLARARLTFEQVYDETVYIHRSIEMVRNNLGLGVMLAIVVLWWFLRKLRATLLVAVSIPVSAVRGVHLPGLRRPDRQHHFPGGLGVRGGDDPGRGHRGAGERRAAARAGHGGEGGGAHGAGAGLGALLASTATTVAIFLPIVFLDDEAGQLFADLALTISVAVVASMVVALTVIPAAASKWLARAQVRDRHAHWWRRATAAIVWLTDGPVRRGFWIVVLLTVPLGATLALAPKSILGLLPIPERFSAALRTPRWRCARATCPRATATSSSPSSSPRRGEHRPSGGGDGQRRRAAAPALPGR